VDATLPVVSIGLGVFVFGEQVNTSAAGLAGAAAGLALLVAGIVTLDTSGVVREEQRREKAERPGTTPTQAGRSGVPAHA
jgi:hypothetical protein